MEKSVLKNYSKHLFMLNGAIECKYKYLYFIVFQLLVYFTILTVSFIVPQDGLMLTMSTLIMMVSLCLFYNSLSSYNVINKIKLSKVPNILDEKIPTRNLQYLYKSINIDNMDSLRTLNENKKHIFIFGIINIFILISVLLIKITL
jgi:hypothetical protein